MTWVHWKTSYVHVTWKEERLLQQPLLLSCTLKSLYPTALVKTVENGWLAYLKAANGCYSSSLWIGRTELRLHITMALINKCALNLHNRQRIQKSTSYILYLNLKQFEHSLSEDVAVLNLIARVLDLAT